MVNRLAEQGIKKRDLTREQFLEHAWDWTNEHGGIILKQLRRLGASCDWDRTAFTMDEKRSESVLKVFVDLYKKGLIYRGLRMVNWDPKAQTVLSTEEVIYRDEKSHLFNLRYYVADADTNPVVPTGCEGEVLHQDADGRYYAVVATTRPETIMGDTAMCVNPKDPKNQWLRGHKVIVPLVNRVIPVIEDRYVDIEFGTGCLKVTPAHDVNDYALGKTHNLETIDIFNPDGTISEAAGMVVGWTYVIDRLYCIFEQQGYGHLVATTSAGGLRGEPAAPAYSATKAYQINYMEAIRKKAFRNGDCITVTDVRPGLVDTAMAKGEGLFWVMPVEKVASQIIAAISKKKSKVYVTKRWHILALLYRILPFYIFKRL